MVITVNLTEVEVKKLCALVDIKVNLDFPDMDVEDAIKIILDNF